MNCKLTKPWIFWGTVGLILSISPFLGFATSTIRVIGIGEVNESFFDITLNKSSKGSQGTLIYSHHQSGEVFFGEVKDMKLESSNKVSFSGTCISDDGKTQTFEGVVEDWAEPGDGKDRFSIKVSDGYTNSGTLTYGDVRIFQ